LQIKNNRARTFIFAIRNDITYVLITRYITALYYSLILLAEKYLKFSESKLM